ncbi:uncharacterized protein LOC110430756 [Sorghum bicolor]|uniref:Embryo surrounding factor 1 brassicaceae domain-containing protein n=1 Tax=Sorghum bicolor TaxID=4558 RepID=A0A194YI84_SORBI|nr:uncharacterized protein LOC110430756 [Sorghum bicolor]KXG19311.1 hypothetical protein SORBI_3010G039600 [Sorghum bicolor]|eukprot:XP_021304345.1 uncharacterized protein LOC110430756 [Sorghum bicolor]
MGRCGGMALYLIMAIVLPVVLFASSANCRPEPLDANKASSNGHAMALNDSTATTTSLVNGSSGSGGGDVKLVWCIMRKCVYEGRGNAPCFCCAAMKPNACYETRDQCNGNCV